MTSMNFNKERTKTIIEEELAPFIIQLRARDDPETAGWQPANEHAVAGGSFIINERQPSGDYDLLKVPILNGLFSGRSITEGMCSVTEQDTEAEDRLIFPDLDRILALAYPDAKTFIGSGVADQPCIHRGIRRHTYAAI